MFPIPEEIPLPLFLIAAVLEGKFDLVKAALEAGASPNGTPEQPLPPIVAATRADRASMIDFLLEQGADPDKPVTAEIPGPANSDMATANPGERALHLAARTGRVEIVRLLLERGRADPNATDNLGRTPLIATCACPQVCVEVVRLLLEAGADPALAEKKGFTALHVVASGGHMAVVDMLNSRTPATLNLCTANGQTPLFSACYGGRETMASKLLSLGAMQQTPLGDRDMCPLLVAVSHGFMGVVRVLISEGGLRAVGGCGALPKSLALAVRLRRVRTLQLLLTVDGEKGRSEWANTYFQGRRLLHDSAGFCYPSAVSLLLEAGADEAALDSEGRIPRDVIGLNTGQEGLPPMDRAGEVAIRRMLQRGPAYRARSWAWPSDEEADAGDNGDGDVAGAAGAALSSAPAMKTPPVVGVRIFRPKEKSSSKLFSRLVDRYCAKE